MLATRSPDRTVDGMASFSTAASAGDGPVQGVDVLSAVAYALQPAGKDGDWARLEAWATALMLVTSAALRSVPEELHDFL